MRKKPTFVDRFGSDSIIRWERAAELRHKDALQLMAGERYLGALYLFGYCVEMCLAAACFRADGFRVNANINFDTRRRLIVKARLALASNTSDPHPLPGWARLLFSLRQNSAEKGSQSLREAINKADLVYQYWRPELRYRTIDVGPDQCKTVQQASEWFLKQRGQF